MNRDSAAARDLTILLPGTRVKPRF